MLLCLSVRDFVELKPEVFEILCKIWYKGLGCIILDRDKVWSLRRSFISFEIQKNTFSNFLIYDISIDSTQIKCLSKRSNKSTALRQANEMVVDRKAWKIWINE